MSKNELQSSGEPRSGVFANGADELYSSLAHPCNQISGSHENLPAEMCEKNDLLSFKLCFK